VNTRLQTVLSVVAALALLGMRLPAETEKPAETSFTAALSIRSDDPGVEGDIVAKLASRAESLDLKIKIDPGAADDSKFVISLVAIDQAAARAQIESLIKSPRLDFRKVHPESEHLAPLVLKGLEIVPGYKIYAFLEVDDARERESQLLLSTRDSIQIERHIRLCYPDAGRVGVINVSLTAEGGKLMRKLTEPMQKGSDRIAILFDDKVQSAPVVQDTLSSNFILSGLNEREERKALVALLNTPLGAELAIDSLAATAPAAP
jgi:preprotein translocase subunit SecD